MTLQRHKHTGQDSNRISYNDLKDKPAAAASTQFAHWQVSITASAWTHVVTWVWFTPKFIMFQAYTSESNWTDESWSHCDWSYHVADNTNKVTYITELNNNPSIWASVATASNTSLCYYVVVDVGTNKAANWYVSATSTDGFTITKGWVQIACKLQWTAFW